VADSDLEAWRASRGSWHTYTTATSRGAFTTLETHREEVAYQVSAAEERPEALAEISTIAPQAIGADDSRPQLGVDKSKSALAAHLS